MGRGEGQVHRLGGCDPRGDLEVRRDVLAGWRSCDERCADGGNDDDDDDETGLVYWGSQEGDD